MGAGTKVLIKNNNSGLNLGELTIIKYVSGKTKISHCAQRTDDSGVPGACRQKLSTNSTTYISCVINFALNKNVSSFL